MDEYNKLLEEYFHESTTEERKSELRNEISKLNPDHPDRILFELGEEVTLQNKVRTLNSTIEEIANTDKGSWPYLKLVASVALVLLTVFSIYKIVDSNQSEEELFTAYFQPYPELISVRLQSENETSWKKALKKYQVGKYAEGLELFKAASPPISYQEDVTFYHAMTLLALRKSGESIALLMTIEGGKYAQQVRWYLALAHLESNEPNQAKDLLLEINENDFNWSDAQELLREIDRSKS
ncbi:MAG: hypothetical protein ABJG47_16035 [Ekhidna sp.]